MPLIQGFRDLRVYQLARKSSHKIFQITMCFPKEERYALISQMRRSSRAVNAMLAEAWARRYYIAAFTNKVDEALGEAMETQAWLDHAFDCKYINVKQFAELDKSWQQIGGMLRRMIDKASYFCPTSKS
ncbi:MAG TPA: four helix bundle protein [Acidobacteriota bacterium]|nr:four helix bundle protein [Acidobacteriota bacterium]